MKLKDKANFLVAESRKLFFLQTVYLRTVQYNPPAVGLVERPHNLKQGSFPCPAGSYDTYHFSFIYSQVDSLQHMQRTETLGYSFQLNHTSTIYVSHILPDSSQIPQACSSPYRL